LKPIRKTFLTIFGIAVLAFNANSQYKVIKSEFIYNKASFPSCHASTIEETPTGLVTAWFGGTDEGNIDVGIWVSRLENNKWTSPIEVADGVQNPTLRHPTWNPVLFQMPKGELLLFYKVGPSPSTWWGMLKRSFDGGKTWSDAEKLPEGIVGPIKNKPELLADGTLICPTSSEDNGWRVHFEMTKDAGKTWTRTEAINDGKEFSAIQPSIIFLKNGDLKLLCRSKNSYVLEATSKDNGLTWSKLQPTKLPNPSSGTDAVTLKNGSHLLVYNHTDWASRKTNEDREILNLAFSKNGADWKPFLVLENEKKQEFSYPAIIQTSDGKVHITYTWKREKIRHVVLTKK
jgi:predicted neuraminidase